MLGPGLTPLDQTYKISYSRDNGRLPRRNPAGVLLAITAMAGLAGNGRQREPGRPDDLGAARLFS